MSSTSDLQAAYDAAVSVGRTWRPTGTHVLDRGPLWIDRRDSRIVGDDFKIRCPAAYAGPALIVGLPRTPGGIGIDDGDSFDLSTWVLSAAGRRGIDFGRGGRTLPNGRPLLGHVAFAGTTLDARDWSKDRQLTIEFLVSDLDTGPLVGLWGSQVGGIAGQIAPAPWAIYQGDSSSAPTLYLRLSDGRALNVSFRQPSPPIAAPYHHVAVQLDLDRATARCWVDSRECQSSRLPPGLSPHGPRVQATPLPGLANDIRGPLIINAIGPGTYGGSAPFGDPVRPRKWGGLKISTVAQYDSDLSGNLIGADGRPKNPLDRLWYKEAGCLGFLPLTETAEERQARVVSWYDGKNHAGMYLGNEYWITNATYTPGIVIRDVDVEASTAALIGSALDLSIQDSRFVGRTGWGLGSIASTVAYTTKLKSLRLNGGDAALNLDRMVVWANDLIFDGIGHRTTIDLDHCKFVMDRGFTTDRGDPDSIVRSYGSHVTIREFMVDLEGGQIPRIAVFDCEAIRSDDGTNIFRLDGLAYGHHDAPVPLVRLWGNETGFVEISHLDIRGTSPQWGALVVVENDKWQGTVDAATALQIPKTFPVVMMKEGIGILRVRAVGRGD